MSMYMEKERIQQLEAQFVEDYKPIVENAASGVPFDPSAQNRQIWQEFTTEPRDIEPFIGADQHQKLVEPLVNLIRLAASAYDERLVKGKSSEFWDNRAPHWVKIKEVMQLTESYAQKLFTHSPEQRLQPERLREATSFFFFTSYVRTYVFEG